MTNHAAGRQPDPAAGLRVHVAGERADVVLARPERRNSQTPATWAALVQVKRELPATVRVVVLRGDGPSFSAGLDRSLFDPGAPDGVLSLASLPAADAQARIATWQDAFDWSSRADLVTVAAVQGHAVGGGFQLALGTDIRIAAEDVQFCMAEPSLGIVPDLGGTKRLVELVGVSRATEICLTGRRVGGEEALRIGLASALVAPEELHAATERTVAALLAVPRDAAAETKALLARASGCSQDEQQAAEREAQYRRLRALAGFDAED